jgi:hypothetical protein
VDAGAHPGRRHPHRRGLRAAVCSDAARCACSSDVFKFLPSGAGGSFISVPLESGTLSPWTGLAVLAIWVAIALAAAALLPRRRDAWLTPMPNGRFPSVELATALPDGGTEDAGAQVLGQAHGGRRHRARVAISYYRANRTVPGRSPQDPGGFERGGDITAASPGVLGVIVSGQRGRSGVVFTAVVLST